MTNPPKKRALKKKAGISGADTTGKVGRPSKLNEKTIEKICQLSRFLIPKHVAAASVGIRRETLFEWERIGKQHIEEGIEDSLPALLVKGIEEAEAQGHANAVGNVYNSGVGGLTWLLQRRFPETYSETTYIKMEVSRALEEMIAKAAEVLPPEMLDLLLVAWGAKVDNDAS